MQKTQFYVLCIVVVLGLVLNSIGVFFYKEAGLYFIIANSGIFIGMFLYIIFSSKRQPKKDDNKKEDDIYILKEELQQYEFIIRDCIASLEKIKLISEKISEAKTENNNINQDVLSITIKSDLNNNENNKPTLNSSSYYKNLHDKIISSIKFDKFSTIMNAKNTTQELLKDIFTKIPYFNKLLDNIKAKTEKIILTLIDKFHIVSESNSKASREAEKNIQFLKNIYGGKDFDEVAKESKEAYKKTKRITGNLISLNIENRKKFDKIENWIKQINKMLKNIQEISEQNKIIAINSSIEAARIGDAGKGFRVLVQEIQSLNQKTSTFTKEINQIMQSFEEYNKSFISEWDNETKNIVEYMEKIITQEEKTINKFIESFELTIRSFQDLSSSTFDIDKNLTEILQSLQYEDITGQQIKHINEFLKDIYAKIRNEEQVLSKIEIDLHSDKDFDNKIKEELLERVTVIDEKHIILDKKI